MKKFRHRKGGKKKALDKEIRKVAHQEMRKELEHKYVILQNQSNVATVDGLGTGFALLNGIGPGSTFSSRTGNEIRLTKLNMKLNITNGVATQAYNTRVLLVFDKQANGSNPLINNIFGVAAGTACYLSPYNPDVVPSRYEIIYDKTFKTNVYGGANDRSEQQIFNINKTFKGMGKLIQYNGTGTATISSINRNSLFLIVITDVATNQPTVGWGMVLHFQDQ